MASPNNGTVEEGRKKRAFCVPTDNFHLQLCLFLVLRSTGTGMWSSVSSGEKTDEVCAEIPLKMAHFGVLYGYSVTDIYSSEKTVAATLKQQVGQSEWRLCRQS